MKTLHLDKRKIEVLLMLLILILIEAYLRGALSKSSSSLEDVAAAYNVRSFLLTHFRFNIGGLLH